MGYLLKCIKYLLRYTYDKYKVPVGVHSKIQGTYILKYLLKWSSSTWWGSGGLLVGVSSQARLCSRKPETVMMTDQNEIYPRDNESSVSDNNDCENRCE